MKPTELCGERSRADVRAAHVRDGGANGHVPASRFFHGQQDRVPIELGFVLLTFWNATYVDQLIIRHRLVQRVISSINVNITSDIHAVPKS